MTAPFVLAVPSKGRLQENAEAFFTRAGLSLAKPRGARDYRGGGTAVGRGWRRRRWPSARAPWARAFGHRSAGVRRRDQQLLRHRRRDGDRRRGHAGFGVPKQLDHLRGDVHRRHGLVGGGRQLHLGAVVRGPGVGAHQRLHSLGVLHPERDRRCGRGRYGDPRRCDDRVGQRVHHRRRDCRTGVLHRRRPVEHR